MTIAGNAPVVERAQEIFTRDWTSAYTVPLPYPDPTPGMRDKVPPITALWN